MIVIVYGVIQVYNSPLFNIRTIDVTGNSMVSDTDIIATSGLSVGNNLLRAPVRAAVEQLELNPWVKDVSLKKLLPQRLLIEVTERVPMVLVSTGTKNSILDREGFVITEEITTNDATLLDVTLDSGVTQDLQFFPDLPIVEAFEQEDQVVGDIAQSRLIKDAVLILDSLDGGVKSRVETMVVGGEEELRFYLSSGIEVYYGSSKELQKKNRSLVRILADYASRGEAPIYVDVRTPDNPVARDLPTD